MQFRRKRAGGCHTQVFTLGNGRQKNKVGCGPASYATARHTKCPIFTLGCGRKRLLMLLPGEEPWFTLRKRHNPSLRMQKRNIKPPVFAKLASYQHKCPFLCWALCPCFLCFHTHSGFEPILLTSFCRSRPRNRGIRDILSETSPRAPPALPTLLISPLDYTHISRLCQ